MTVSTMGAADRHARTGDVVADIVGDVVASTRRGTALYGRQWFHAPWGVHIPASGLASVHVITAGACWLVPDGGEPIHLTRGDVAMMPSGIGHSLVDTPGRAARPLEELLGGPVGQVAPKDVVIAGDGPATGLLCGGYLLDSGPRHPLTTVLPPVVTIDAGQARGSGLAAAVDLLSAEATRTDPGAPAIVTTLIDLMFVYVLREWLAEQSRNRGGWVSALYDPVVGGALARIHADPGKPWSVAALARAVEMPRATFTRRFTALTGQSPMAYVTAWRMSVAARLLREDHASVRDVATSVGYDSEFAFARAFKRIVGHPPGRFRTAGEPPPAIETAETP